MVQRADIPIISSDVPSYAHDSDAGADLTAAEPATLRPGERALVPTGVAIAIPDGHVGFVVPRSGLAVRHGISIVNSPGTIDSGYRGEIKVALVNTDHETTFHISAGDRIAQLVIQEYVKARFVPVDALPTTQRGDGGFGSTGYAAAQTEGEGC